MTERKKLDVIVGVKAEQSLRDAVRALIENHDNTELELTPVGRKDWIAGQRIGADTKQLHLEQICRDVHKKLLALGSNQRIRSENLRLYVVQPPVPVFKDPLTTPSATSTGPEPVHQTEPLASPEPESSGGPSTCPVCGRNVHSYNLHYNTDGKVVGCFMCGGNPNGF